MLSALTFDLPMPSLAMLLMVLATAGLVSGLSGFGFSAVGAAILAWLPPSHGVPLLMALSTANQLLSLRQLKDEMPPLQQWWPDGPGPLLVGGMLGLPIGLWMLGQLAPATLMMLFGALLLGYALFSLFRPARWRIEVVLPCTLAGVAIYRRMSDHNFRQVTLTLLGVAGIGLLGKVLMV